MKLNWANLSKDERLRYMQLQVSPQGGYDYSGYLPEGCGECGACGQPIMGTGWCSSCYQEWYSLRLKLCGVSDEIHNQLTD